MFYFLKINGFIEQSIQKVLPQDYPETTNIPRIWHALFSKPRNVKDH